MSVVASVLSIFLWLFFVALLIRLVFDWVQLFARSWEPHGIVLLLLEGVYSVTDPPLRALRRVIPPLRIGSIAFDLAFIILLIATQIALRVVSGLR